MGGWRNIDAVLPPPLEGVVNRFPPPPPAHFRSHAPATKHTPRTCRRHFPREGAALHLNIIAVGAGIGGIAAAHTLAHARYRVTLLESCRGDPSLVSPNATRLLLHWGLGPGLRAHAVEPTAIVFRRYHTGVRVGSTRRGSHMTRDHGASYYHIHRADYHAMLYRLTCTAPGP